MFYIDATSNNIVTDKLIILFCRINLIMSKAFVHLDQTPAGIGFDLWDFCKFGVHLGSLSVHPGADRSNPARRRARRQVDDKRFAAADLIFTYFFFPVKVPDSCGSDCPLYTF